jgi:leucyl aminopeptidase
LADALSYAVQRYKPDVIIDFATLTGACVVALGKQIAGLFTNSEKLKEACLESGERTGEKVWPMPLYEPYLESLRSEVADIKNSAGRDAGAIKAALFLSQFVGKTPWAHLDIAGPAMRTKKEDSLPPGATGFGVRLILDFLQRLSKR